MADSYNINLTDPLSAAFKVKAFTTNGTVFPTSPTLDISTSADTSLLVPGKGAPNYGERVAENLIHILENFSGSTEPLNPISGQLWYARYDIVRTAPGVFWQWNDSSGLWTLLVVGSAAINPTLTIDVPQVPEYNLNGSDVLSLAITDSTSPLAVTWLSRLYEDRIVATDPNTDGLLPRRALKVYSGASWKLANSIVASDDAPESPDAGDLWFDTDDGQLNIHNGISFISVADNYLPLDGTGTMGGPLDMGSNFITDVLDPVNPQDAATMQYVIDSTSGTPTVLGALTDVTITTPLLNEILQYDGVSDWVNTTLDLTSVGVTAVDASELNTVLFGIDVGTAIQTQIDGKLSTNGTDPMSGSLNMGTNPITNVVDPTNPQDAATQAYVLAQVGGIVSNTVDSLTFNSGTFDITLTQALAPNEIVNITHTHGSTDVTHVASDSAIRDLSTGSYPNVLLSEVIETTVNDFDSRLDRLDSFARREVFVAGAAQTDFDFTDGRYVVGSNRLNVFSDGTKQYASERARQRINFNVGKNLSVTAPLGLSTAGVYDLDVAVDLAGATIIVLSLDATSTISTIITQINAALSGAATAMWSSQETAIYIFSDSVGNGSAINIVEGSGAGAAVDGGLLAGLSAVSITSELPVLTYPGNTITPAFPTNVTSITADLDYVEALTTFTSGSQSVDLGTTVITDATGLVGATTYTAQVNVDGGGNQAISILGSDAADFSSLIIEINNDLTGATASFGGANNNIIITSDSSGASSSIAITAGTLFAAPLTGFVAVNGAVAGTTTVGASKFGDVSTTIQFNASLTGGEVIEMISEATSTLVS